MKRRSPEAIKRWILKLKRKIKTKEVGGQHRRGELAPETLQIKATCISCQTSLTEKLLKDIEKSYKRGMERRRLILSSTLESSAVG